MQKIFAAAAILVLIVLVLLRVLQLKRMGIQAFRFGKMDKKDFLIPPFALFMVYVVLAGAFGWPDPGLELFHIESVQWIGVFFCALGLVFFLSSLRDFGKSFRVGIDEQHPGELITTGIFAVSRNPIYTAFGFVLMGIFLVMPNWILLLYLAAGAWLINRQVLREEQSLKKLYGEAYDEYCKKVHRYL